MPAPRKPYFAYRSFVPALEAKRQFAEMGFRQFCVFPANTVNSMGGAYSRYGMLWNYEKVYDFSPLDRQIGEILSFAPDAEFLCMIDLNTPLWLARKLKGDSFTDLSRVIANPEWCRITKEYLQDFLTYAQRKYGSRIAAYILACGQTDEWMDCSRGVESPAKLDRCRAYAAANHLPEIFRIPGWAQRFRSDDGLRDPEKDAEAILYWGLHSALTAEAILDFAHETQKQLNPGQEIGVFYGYILELTAHRLVQCGHLAYEKVLADPTVDFLISPGDYFDRNMGGGGGFMTPNGTVHRCGKNCLHEVDHVTHTGCVQVNEYAELPWVSRWRNRAEDIAGLRREFCRTLLHGASQWFFDMWGEFYAEPELRAEIRNMLKIYQVHADRTRQPDAEVIFLVDPENALRIDDEAPDNPLSELYVKVNLAASRLGAPVQFYSFGDLPALIPCRLFCPVGIFGLTPEKRAVLQDYADRCGNVLAVESPALKDRYPHIPFSEWSAVRLRQEAEHAGGRCYGSPGDVVGKSGNLLSLHCAAGGTREIPVGDAYKSAQELFSGMRLPVKNGILSFEFSSPDTRLFELKTGDKA